MVDIILSIDYCKEQLKLSQTTLDVLKKYVESQGDEKGVDRKPNSCKFCGW